MRDAEKKREYLRAYYFAHKDAMIARQNAVYADRKARGLCVQCGKVPAAAGRVKCEACLRDASARTTRYKLRKFGKERKDDGN